MRSTHSPIALLSLFLAFCAACGGDDGDGKTFEATVVGADAQTNGDTTNKNDGSSASSDASKDAAAPPNKPPVATYDLAKTLAGTTFDIFVLDNDSDPDGDKLKITEVTQGKLGLIKIASTGRDVSYAPLDSKTTGVDSFTYTINDGNGGTDSATVTVKIDPPPTLKITAPIAAAAHKGPDVQISFAVTGCTFTNPGAAADGCHAHKYLDGKSYADAEGKGFGQYVYAPFSIGPLSPGKHTIELRLIKNDGSDQPFEPLIADSIAFEVTATGAP